jgi:hypothetical protein
MIEKLYQLYFTRLTAKYLGYALIFVASFAYAMVNDLVLGRPEEIVALESMALVVILMIAWPLGLVLAHWYKLVADAFSATTDSTPELLSAVFLRLRHRPSESIKKGP